MREFTHLFSELDQTTSINEKIHAIEQFLRAHDPATNAWTLFLLTGRRPKRLIGSGKLRQWAEDMVGLPKWLVEECYSSVGDTAEMISLIVAASPLHRPLDRLIETSESRAEASLTLAHWMDERIFPLAQLGEEQQRTQVCRWWAELPQNEIFILNKLLTGGLRVGVSETLVFRALEKLTGFARSVIASRLLGNWTVNADFYTHLISEPQAETPGQNSKTEGALPYPFCLAAPLEGEAAEIATNLGDVRDWLFEWKWDGIRCQIVKIGREIEIWSRGEERITDSFPDLVGLAQRIDGSFIMDGELLIGSWKNPQPFQELQKRLNRKKPSTKMQTELPVTYSAYDFLSRDGLDLSALPLKERRQKLEEFLAPHLDERMGLSPKIEPTNWQEAEALKKEARAKGAEGLMIKSLAAPYQVGRKRGVWFKWKIDPLTVDAVLSAAQPGTGRRASLYTDYTFSIWKEETLVPIAKAYSGLTDEEIRELDGWIRRHTIDRFGPVRTLKLERVFELGFEGIAPSTRHKSGYALRFPRILRERLDKKAADADRVETLRDLCTELARGTTAPTTPVSATQAKKARTTATSAGAGVDAPSTASVTTERTEDPEALDSDRQIEMRFGERK